MKPVSVEKKEKIFWKGGKEFSLFPKPLNGMEMKCPKTKKVFKDIAIHLSAAAVSLSPIYLSIYQGVSLAVHGIQVGTTLVGRDTIVAFGMESSSEPSMAAKITCFRNFDQLISCLNNYIAGL